ncbi:hypothetical protein QJQ45_020613, partial [Haematococcus lacustris]
LSRTVLNSRHASRGQHHLANGSQRSALPTTPQPRGQPCKFDCYVVLRRCSPCILAVRSSSQVQPGAAANKQPRGAAKMCSKEAHVGAAAISHAVQLPRWHMT